MLLFGKPSVPSLKTFLTEFYHDDHGLITTRVVVLHPEEPSQELVELLDDFEYCQYIKGSPMVEIHLIKSHASAATAVFMMCNPAVKDSYLSDLDTLLSFNSVKAHKSKNLEQGACLDDKPIYLQLLTKRAADLKTTAAERTICQENLRLGILARSVGCPGFSTMISNLVQSAGRCCVEHMSGCRH